MVFDFGRSLTVPLGFILAGCGGPAAAGGATRADTGAAPGTEGLVVRAAGAAQPEDSKQKSTERRSMARP